MTEQEKLIAEYRRVFNTPEGKRVLADILYDLGYFSKLLEGEQALARHNAATNLLGKCGVWIPQNIYGITDKLMELSPWTEE